MTDSASVHACAVNSIFGTSVDTCAIGGVLFFLISAGARLLTRADYCLLQHASGDARYRLSVI